MKTIFAATIGAALLASAAPATVTVSLEAPGVQQTTQTLLHSEVATFDSLSGWVGSGNIFAGAISGTITDGGFLTPDANIYGGAGGTGKYGVVQTITTLQLSNSVTYAGLWASAIDGNFATTLGNTVALYAGTSLVGSYALMPLLAGTGSAYYGNPNSGVSGSNNSEPYAFFNFNSTTAFDRIDLIENGGGGFELDNVTIGNPSSASGGAGAVPEPASWALMLIGFGATGAALRGTRRRTALV